MPAALWLALTVLLGAPEGGLWLPTSGRAGERSVQALGTGGDAALYAAGGGVIYRLEPGAEWMRLGRYAPRLTWEPNGEIVAHGSLPGWLLRQVEVEADEHVEIPEGLDDRDSLPREVVRDLLRDFVEEQANQPRSAYHVEAIVQAPRGVWIATGAGLFRATRDGVTGPRPDIRGPVNAVLHRKDETLVGTDSGLWRIPPEAPAVQLRVGTVTALTESAGSVYFVEDGRIWAGHTVEAAHPLDAPAASPLAMAADTSGLYLATRLAVYRRSEGQWTLCAPVSSPPTRLATGEGVLHAVSPQAVHLYTEGCGQVSSVGPPWPGGFDFTDVARQGGLVWAAANQGVFMLAPLDADTSLTVQMEGYRRAVAAIPTMDVLVVRALETHRLDAETFDAGLRPAWSRLLPEVRGRLTYEPRRIETFDRTSDMYEIEVTKPQPAWQVMAWWRIDFQRFLGFSAVTPLEYLEGGGFDAEELGESEGAAIEEVEDLATEEIVYDDEAFGLTDSSDLADELEATGISLMAQDKKRTALERRKVVTQVRRLYQQRQNLLYRLWVQRSKDLQQRTTLLLSVDELDARLSAITGIDIRSTGRPSTPESTP